MSALLRDGVLDGVRIAFAGASGGPPARCAALGADVLPFAADLGDDEVAAAAAGALGAVDVLVCDTREPFGEGGLPGLRAALDGAFLAARACLNGPFAAAGRGRIVLIAPAPGAGEHAGAVRAGLENEARGLSTEWARLGVTVVAILPGDATAADDVADLVAFLASAAGGYYAGCALTLDALGTGRPLSR